MNKFTAIVLAAGSGKRMEQEIPKQYMDIGGAPLMVHCLRTFQESKCTQIVLVVAPGDVEKCRKEIIEKYHIDKCIAIVEGGEERYDSVYAGLQAINDGYVLIQSAFLPVKGLQALIKTIYTVKRRLNAKLEVEGILLTMVDNRTNYAKEIVSEVNEVYGKSLPVFPIEIPLSIRASETSAMSKSIFEYDPKGKVAKAYSELTSIVMKNS